MNANLASRSSSGLRPMLQKSNIITCRLLLAALNSWQVSRIAPPIILHSLSCTSGITSSLSQIASCSKETCPDWSGGSKRSQECATNETHNRGGDLRSVAFAINKKLPVEVDLAVLDKTRASHNWTSLNQTRLTRWMYSRNSWRQVSVNSMTNECSVYPFILVRLYYNCLFALSIAVLIFVLWKE